MNVLVTGAAGSVGRILATPMLEAGHMVVRTDLHPDGDITRLDVTDADAVAAACEGMDAIVHLGGIPSESTFEKINQINIVGTHNVLVGAVAAGVGRVILASSNHAVGFYRRSELPPDTREMPDPPVPRPDTYYGWSKAATESLASLFHDRHGIGIIALRIGSCYEEPTTTRMLATWLAPLDAGQLVNACLALPSVGFHTVWAVSDNTRRWWSLAGAKALGYRPTDNSERFARDLIDAYGEPDPSDPIHDYVGGQFCDAPLGVPMK
jgi:nucleoside-diphosphate-sugar epimerase